MAKVSRNTQLRFSIEDLLSNYPTHSEITVTLYDSEIRKLQRLYPKMEIKKLKYHSGSKKYRCIITKKDT